MEVAAAYCPEYRQPCCGSSYGKEALLALLVIYNHSLIVLPLPAKESLKI